jgi:membrane-associated phospholipid phosphatase
MRTVHGGTGQASSLAYYLHPRRYCATVISSPTTRRNPTCMTMTPPDQPDNPDNPVSPPALYSGEAQPALEADEQDADIAIIEDIHSTPVAEADVQSVSGDRPAAAAVAVAPRVQPAIEAPGAQAPPADGAKAPPAQAAQAVVETAKQTTQQVKQATQQVTAAVQQQAQKVTVAPRKAIYRGKRFLFGYAGLVGATGALAYFAKRHRYFAGDVGITRFLQAPNLSLYDGMMHLVSQLGWRWISVGTRASLSTLMWAAGFRMESAFTVSTWTGDLVTVLIKTRVLRPRPTADLVRVTSDLEEASFPSGHVVHYVTFYGFLYYLVYIHFKQRWFRTGLLGTLAGLVLLVGPSRVYMGHHWPSDVAGAYLVGTLWLGVIIVAYLETKANYTLHTHPPFFVKRPAQLG